MVFGRLLGIRRLSPLVTIQVETRSIARAPPRRGNVSGDDGEIPGNAPATKTSTRRRRCTALRPAANGPVRESPFHRRRVAPKTGRPAPGTESLDGPRRRAPLPTAHRPPG